ncbi:hypothetical protein [Bradyrhizobium sp. LHD-71]|uniref:hypothetical protein n=1 Tax=Bradyrhizobium sp. LHD-71 TaxID=3072141 RepID=UPI00280CDCAD|nr:hypothetical protein [Bradyrhizobium sp. LHD-71]MDQ8730517.1 hypothetical protein [Bradyrhizobium sp. LHD-71]
MRRIPKATYLTADEIDLRNRQRELEAANLPPTCAQYRAVMKEIAQWRSYAEAKRWIESQGSKPDA